MEGTSLRTVGATILLLAAAALAPAASAGGDDVVRFWPEEGNDFEVHDPDAECFVTVPVGQTRSCSASWDQAKGNYSGDWHSTFHDLSALGRISLTVEDADGRVVLDRECVWLGPVAVTGIGGVCRLRMTHGNHSEGTPGTWTMTLTARVDAAAGLDAESHAQFGLDPL